MDAFVNALVADKPVGRLRDELDMFGRLVGAWDFRWKWSGAEGNGEWLFSWILGGKGIQDVFIWPPRNERENRILEEGEYGTTIRMYNEWEHHWNIYYSNGGTGSVGIARPRGDDIVIDMEPKEDDAVRVRWMFTAITDTSFRWQNMVSNDAGFSFETRGELLATRTPANEA